MNAGENVAARLTRWAEMMPDRLALVVAERRRGRFKGATFADLDRRTGHLAAGFRAAGIEPGMRVALMVPIGRGVFEAGFGLMKAGATPVLVDPGIGRTVLGDCLAEASVAAFVGVPEALAARRVLGWAPDARVVISAGPRVPGVPSLRRVAAAGRTLGDPDLSDPGHPAAIVFTSGSTGPPKGVEYGHGHFAAQLDLVGATYGIEPGEVNVATFTPFALLGPLLGMTTVMPHMDFTKPGSVDPRRIVDAVEGFGATMMFGSPALLDRVGRSAVRLPSLRRVLSAGAPVRPAVRRRFETLLTHGATVHTPYGATEALPVATISGPELDGLDDAPGICVGRPVPGVEVTLVPVSDRPFESVEAAGRVADGDVGEIVVRGPNVTARYHRRPEANLAAKLSWDGRPAHRMGDLGRFDTDGRIWFCGRKSHRIPTEAGDLYSVPVEQVVERHPAVRRAALVGISPAQTPAVCVELETGYRDARELRADILSFLRQEPAGGRVSAVYVHPAFPTDIRHNSKIDRPALGWWASGIARDTR